MRGILAALLVAMAVFLAAGCGGSSNDAAGTTETTDTTAVTDTTTETDTTSSTDTTTSGTETSLAGLSEGCQKVADLSMAFGTALSSAASGNAETDLEQTAEAYETFAENVPEEIQDSFKTLATAFAQYATALEGLDLSSGGVPDAETIAKLAKAAKALDNESLSAANTQISAWVEKNCNTGG